MLICPQNFWRETYYNNPQITNEDIARAEALLGQRFPAECTEPVRVPCSSSQFE